MFDDLTQKLHKKGLNDILKKENRINNISFVDSRNIQLNQNRFLFSNTLINTQKTQKSSFLIN